jgi:cell cycle checkpoint protein
LLRLCWYFRNHQKVLKPQFFEAYRRERDNVSALDAAIGYIVKKAVTVSEALAEKPLHTETDMAVWGGVPSRQDLAVELVPMMIKIQALTRSELRSIAYSSFSTRDQAREGMWQCWSTVPLLPSTVQSLALPPFSSFFSPEEELRSNVMEIDNDEEADDPMNGERAYTASGGWDDTPEQPTQEDEEEGLEGDAIEDWDWMIDKIQKTARLLPNSCDAVMPQVIELVEELL